MLQECVAKPGHRLRAGHIADKDAPLVARLQPAGAIVLGVTNTPEFLMAGKPTTFSMDGPTIPGTFRVHPVDRAVGKRRRLPRDVPREASGATAGAPFACPHISAASAD